MFHRSWVLLPLWFLGCAASSVRSTAAGNGRPAQITLQVQALPTGTEQWMPLSPSQSLHSGDRFALAVEAERAAYLYVAQAAQAGVPEVLFPQAQDGLMKVAPGSPIHLPADGKWFRLDERTGEETVYVVASGKSLTSSQLLDEIGKAAKKPPEKDRDPPPEMSEKNRDPPPEMSEKNRGFDQERRVLRGDLVPDGVTVMRFSFRHE